MRSLLAPTTDPHGVLQDKTLLGHRPRTERHDRIERVGPLAIVLERVLSSHGAGGRRPLHVHRPQHDVEVMHAPRHLVPAPGQLHPIVAVVVVAVGIVRSRGSRSRVEVPIQLRRRIAVRRRPVAGPPVLVVPHFDFGDFAQLARLDNVHRFPVMFAAALLRAELNDLVVLPGRLHQRTALANAVAQRLSPGTRPCPP